MWSEGEIDALRAAASSLGAAIQRQQVDDALLRLQAFNEDLLLKMTEGIVVDDAEGRVIFANPSAIQALGYSHDELMGLHWSTYIPADQRSRVREANRHHMGGQADTYEIELMRKDGKRLPVLVSGSPRFERGMFGGTMAVFTDIAERQAGEEALAQRASGLEALYTDLARHLLAAGCIGSAGADHRPRRQAGRRAPGGAVPDAVGREVD